MAPLTDDRGGLIGVLQLINALTADGRPARFTPGMEPLVTALAEAGVLLCLGTDGLTSNTDLDVRQEAVALQEQGLSPEALVRMLTVNGAAALGRGDLGTLEPGRPARWAVLPNTWEIL